MAKPTYAKLKLSADIAPKELEWGEQKIEIKQYLSIQDKLEFIGDVLNAAADDNRFYSQGNPALGRSNGSSHRDQGAPEKEGSKGQDKEDGKHHHRCSPCSIPRCFRFPFHEQVQGHRVFLS